MNLPELDWIKIARSYIGLKEVKGFKHSPAIVEMLNAMGSFSKENKASVMIPKVQEFDDQGFEGAAELHAAGFESVFRIEA